MIQPGMILQQRYQVIRELGKGGFAQTFEVDDGGTLKVLKVLDILVQRNCPKAVLLFQQEARVLSQLNHSGIPKVDPDGYFTWLANDREPLHCLVMEKIDGQNLEKWLISRDRQPISQDEAFAWLKQLVAILQVLHQQKYFHRDIKPSNIMVKPNGELVLIDFGAAREVTESYLYRQDGNITGTKIGSPGYQPPEQMEGHALPQSDFFALGRTFVHLLTGMHPIRLRHPQTGEFFWQDRAPQISASLADFLNELTAFSPQDRPQNTQEIQQLLAEAELASAAYPLIVTQNESTITPTQSGESSNQKTIINSLKKPPVQLGQVTKYNIKLLVWIEFILSNVWLLILLLLRLVSFGVLLPKLEVVFNDRGVDNHLTNRLGLAKFYYQCALLLKPEYKKAHYNLGSLYEKQHQFDLARSNYKIAIEGEIPAAYNNLARLHILEKNYGLAIELLQEGLKLAQDDEVNYAFLKNIGWALLKQKRYTKAKTYLLEAIRLKSDRAAAYGVLAQVLQAQGDKINARLAWENLLKYAPDDHSPEVDAWLMIAP